MAPTVLEADARADVDKGEVVVERILANRREDPPGGDGCSDQQEPAERGEPEVAEDLVIDPPENT